MSFRFFQSLLLRAAKIQQRIDDEQRRKSPDRMRLLKLKKIRLLIADKLQHVVGASAGLQLRPVPVRKHK